jgi:Streptomycin adenylyltransferase
MNHQDLINVLVNKAKTDLAVRAIFLKGSLARGDGDEYADVDFYCLVKENEQARFLTRRLEILTTYRPLLYWSEVYFIAPQIVGIFDSGEQIDFYTVTTKTLPITDQTLVLYDPEGLLQDLPTEPQAVSISNLVSQFEMFCLTLYRVERMYRRGDVLWAVHLAGLLISDMAVIYRFVVEPERAQIGLKGLYQKLDADTIQDLKTISNLLTPEKLPRGLKHLTRMMKQLAKSLDEEVSHKLNWAFFEFVEGRIKKL